MYVSSCRLATTGVSICSSPFENVAYEFVPYISCCALRLLRLTLMFVKWDVDGRTVLWGTASRICSKQCVAFLCSSYVAFCSSVSLASTWCIHRVVLTKPQLERNTVLFYDRSDFYMAENLPKAIDVFAMRMLTSFSVDEILLPRYGNWSTVNKNI